jgi:predicted nucleotide-binding protein (sugar kinase/HSP70/actin superfamily)
MGQTRLQLPVVGDSVQDSVAQYRLQLEQEAGLIREPKGHFKRPKERAFTRSEKGKTTVLFGGLTLRHELLCMASLEGLGHKVAIVPTPIKADFQAGKEYGNNGQCNPTYFTVGSLVNYLKRLRDEEGLSTEKILEDYTYMTAGACGPCRFGMYEAEYRLALRNSGFDGFRVMLFQQGGGLEQDGEETGFEFNIDFFLSILNAIFIGDLLNEVAYQIRPFETVPGKTDEVFARCVEIMKDALQNRGYAEIRGGRLAKLLSKVAPLDGPDAAQKFLDQLLGGHYIDAMKRCRQIIDEEIEVDLTRCKPVVKVTGEFWAQTTEGDGNFNMFPFLEGEGAEVLVEPIGTWIAYLLHQAQQQHRDQQGLTGEGDAPGKWDLLAHVLCKAAFHKKKMTLSTAEAIIKREYNRLREALGGTGHELVDQLELQRLGHPYYNSRSGGGEGHLEVAKNIYYCNKDLAHMVLSLKPFGCMPSTQSDGAQAAVVSHYSDMIYLPIETSGEGDVNAHSRVQMALGEAKVKAKAEFKEALRHGGYLLEDIQAYVADHAELRRPIQHVPHHKGVIGKAANFVIHVAEQMDQDPIWRERKNAPAESEMASV